MRRFSVWPWPDGVVVFDRETGNTHAFQTTIASEFLAAHLDLKPEHIVANAFDSLMAACSDPDAGPAPLIESSLGRFAEHPVRA